MTERVQERALLRAFVWMRWRVLANGLLRRRRSNWQRLGAVAEVAGKVVLWAMAAGGALAVAGVAAFLPWLLARSESADASLGGPPPEVLLLMIRFVLALFLVTLLVVPAFQGLARGSLGRTRLLLLPIPERVLYGLEVAAHLGDPWLLMAVPALAALAVGTVVVSAPGSLVMLLAGALFLLALVGLSATASFGVELALRDRRRAEALGLVVMLLWLALVLGPSFFQRRNASEEETAGGSRTAQVAAGPEAEAAAQDRAEARRREAERLKRLARFPTALQVLPSEAYARSLSLAAGGRPGAALLPLGVLALAAFGLLALSRNLWRRLQASPAGSGKRTGSTDLPRPWRLPGLSPAASVVAWGQLRGFLRTLVGRLNLAIGPVMALFLTLMIRSDVARSAFGERALGAAWAGVALSVGGAALATLSLQALSLNQFAVDGPGFSLQVLSPLSRRDVVMGKWAASVGLGLALTLLITGVIVSLEPAALPFWPAVLLAAAGAHALLAPATSWLSMLLPKAVDLGRLGRDAQPNQTAVLVGMVVTPLVFLPPIALGAVVFALTRSLAALIVAEAAWVAVGLLVARLLLGPVAATLARREEAIHLALLER